MGGFFWLNFSAFMVVLGDVNVPSVTPGRRRVPTASVISASVIAWRYLLHALIRSIITLECDFPIALSLMKASFSRSRFGTIWLFGSK